MKTHECEFCRGPASTARIGFADVDNSMRWACDECIRRILADSRPGEMPVVRMPRTARRKQHGD